MNKTKNKAIFGLSEDASEKEVLSAERDEIYDFLVDKGFKFREPFIERKYLEGAVRRYFYR